MISKFETNYNSLMLRHFDSLGVLSDVISDFDFSIFRKTLDVNKPEHDYMYWYHKDHLGSSTQISDYRERVIHHVEYMPSGEQFSEQRDIWATPYKFNDYGDESFNKAFDEHTARSAELDAETGLYYYGARYYTPEIGIWLSVDPLSDKYPSLSPYAYCALNPVILVDPDGREITDYQYLKTGEIKQVGYVNNKPDRLFNKDGSEHITVNDKRLLPQLEKNQKKLQKIDSGGCKGGITYSNKAETNNAEDAAKVLDFMSRNSDSEWAVYAEKSDNYNIGTLGLSDRAPSPFGMGLDKNNVRAMIHSHLPKSSETSEIGSLDGDKVVSPQYNFSYYTYYGVSKNLYKINKNSTHTKMPNTSVEKMTNILKKK